MGKIDINKLLPLSVLLIFTFFLNCDRDATQSIFVEEPTAKPDPIISSINPPDKTLAGIGNITITGQNFSASLDENAVFFDGVQAINVSASATELIVESPNLPGDSLEVKVNVAGSFLFSNTAYYNLESALQRHSEIGIELEDVYGITADRNENVFVSISRDASGTARRVDRILPDGTREKGWGSQTFLFANHMRIGPGDLLYLTRNTTSLYTIEPGGGNRSSIFARIAGRGYDLDFNQEGSMYTAGNGDSLYLVQTNGDFESVAGYPSTFVRGVRVFGDHVYVAGTEGGTRDAVWRNRINTVNDLGANELVIDVTANIGDSEIQALTFAEDGDMYISITNNDDPIWIVQPDGSAEPLYPGVIKPADADIIEVRDMVWGNDVFMYINRFHQVEEQGPDGPEVTTFQQIIKVNMQKLGALYWGRE